MTNDEVIKKAWSGYDLDGMVEAFSRVIESHHSSKNPFHDPINTDAKMALRILRGFVPAMKACASSPQPMQDPIGFANANNLQGLTLGLYGYAEIYTDDSAERVPLYTTPPQRKPQQTLVAIWNDGKLTINGEEADPGVIELGVDGYTYRSSVKVEVR